MTSDDNNTADSEQRGVARGKASALLAILASKGISPSPADRERIEQCPDPSTIDRWIQAALRGEHQEFLAGAAPRPQPRKRSILGPLLIATGVGVVLFAGLFGAAFWIARPSGPELTAGSARMVSQLDGPMTIDVYVTRGLPKINTFADALQKLMRQYEKVSKGRLQVRFIDVQTEEQRQAAKEEGLQVMVFGDMGEGETAQLAQGVLGMVFKYKAEKDAIPALSPDTPVGLEFWISNKIRELKMKGDNTQLRLGVLAGTGEISLSESNMVPATFGRPGPSMKSIFAQAMPFYAFEDVNLNGGEAEIDGTLQGLIITQPSRDLTDAELRRIDQFVMRGKSLTAFVSASNVAAGDAEMKPRLALHNLDKLLGGYGIVVAPDLLVDTQEGVALPAIGTDGAPTGTQAPCAFVSQHDDKATPENQRLDSTFAGFFRLDGIAFPYASSLTLAPDKQPDAKLRVLARSGPRAHAVREDGLSCKPGVGVTAGPPFAQFAIAAVAEGKLRGVAKDLGGTASFEVPAVSSGDARVLVVASSHFLTNPFARAGGPPDPAMPSVGGDQMLQALAQPYAQKNLTSTILCFKNTLDWMTGDTDLVEASGTLLVPRDEAGPVVRAARWLTTW